LVNSILSIQSINQFIRIAAINAGELQTIKREKNKMHTYTNTPTNKSIN